MGRPNLAKRIATSVAALAVTFAIGTGIGVPAASAAQSFYALTCESGESQFVCDSNVYSSFYQWEILPVNGQINGYIISGQGEPSIWGNCSSRKYVKVRVTTESGVYEKSVYCNPGPWQ